MSPASALPAEAFACRPYLTTQVDRHNEVVMFRPHISLSSRVLTLGLARTCQ